MKMISIQGLTIIYFQIDEKKILSNIKKSSKGQKYKIIKGFFEDTLKNDPKI